MSKISVNKVRFAGFLCADADLNETHKRLTLRLANNHRDNPCFMSVVAWQDVALLNHNLKTGDAVKIKGHLRSTSWETDGQKRYGVEIVCENSADAIEVISTKANGTLAAKTTDVPAEPEVNPIEEALAGMALAAG